MGVRGDYTDVSWSSGDEKSEPAPAATVTPLPAPRRYRRREQPFPAEMRIDVGGKPKAAWAHGYHSKDVVAIPTLMSCDSCVLMAIRRKDPRSKLACPEAKKHATCAILGRHQVAWVEGLVGEVREATGREPTATERARIEQVVRLRSRVFAVETYVRAAGAIDLRTGELRAVMDRINSIENALTRSLDGLRNAIAEARAAKRGNAPSLAEYLNAIATRNSAPLAVQDAASKEIVTESSKEILSAEESDGDDE